jgi:hypothetical protein
MAIEYRFTEEGELISSTGCQMGDMMSRLILQQEIEDAELDAMKRRLFAFPYQLLQHGIDFDDVRGIKDAADLRGILNELDLQEAISMFY